jgi:hypothetical protein
VLFAALAHGRSGCIVPEVTDHVVSNVWLVRQFGATVSMASNSVTVDGINLKRSVDGPRGLVPCLQFKPTWSRKRRIKNAGENTVEARHL